MSRFDSFTRTDLAYRYIDGVPLEATVLVPRSVTAVQGSGKKYPVMVRWHGGGFVLGHRMYEPWFAQWLLDISVASRAIIISPDYRLLPESNGRDILDDIAHFWKWLRDALPNHLDQSHQLQMDLENVMCCGESSGGFISTYCALHLHDMLANIEVQDPAEHNMEQVDRRALAIAAIISISAPLDATGPEYTIPRPRKFMGTQPPPPRQALAKIRAYINGISKGTIRTGCDPKIEMWELLLCIAQQAYLPRLFGPGAEGFMETLNRGENRMVPTWLVHGLDDTMVCDEKLDPNVRL